LVPHGQATQDTQCGEEIALHLTKTERNTDGKKFNDIILQQKIARIPHYNAKENEKMINL